jgi:hypothetical protein
MSIATLTFVDSESSTAARCVGLIERYAPHFMRSGGGALRVDCLRSGRRLTPHQRGMIMKLASRRMSQAEIAKSVGCTAPAVCKLLRKAGVRRTDMRRRAA